MRDAIPLKILAVDPGSQKSGWVLWDTEFNKVLGSSPDEPNESMVAMLRDPGLELTTDYVLVELPALMGQCNFTAEALDTAVWAGRFFQAPQTVRTVFLTRNDVKLHMLGWTNRKGHDPNSCIKQVLLERFPAGKGTKKKPGPLYGISSHSWQALALVFTFLETVYDSAA